MHIENWRKFTFVLLLILSQVFVYSNENPLFQKVDSIFIFSETNPDSALSLLDQYLSVALRKNDNFSVAKVYDAYGNIYIETEKYREAQKKLLLAKNYFQKSDSLSYLSSVFVHLGIILNYVGESDSALNYYFKAEANALEYNNENNLAQAYRSIGLLHIDLGNYDKALSYLKQSLSLVLINPEDIKGKAELLQNMGIVYSRLGELDTTISYYRESLNLFIQLEDIENTAISYNNLGVLYERKKDFDSTLYYYYKALEIFEEIEYKHGIAITLSNIGLIHRNMGNYSETIRLINRSIEISNEIESLYQLLTNLEILAETYRLDSDYKNAFYYLSESNIIYDSINLLEQEIQIQELETIYETEKKEQQIALQQLEIENKNRQTFFLSIILALALGLILLVIRANKKKRKTNRDLKEKNRLLKLQNQKITNSITYASLIQNTILPPVNQFENVFAESFIFFKPKDIVSGDFYWITNVKNKIIVALADCTGHGVPGAFMSMLGMTFLKETIDIKGITDPHIILNQLRENVIEALRQKEHITNTLDGMDMTICSINTKTKELEYSGAFLPMMLYSDGNLVEFKPNRMPIGYHKTRTGSFTRSSYSYKNGDVLYFYTDGFADQFGGDEKKKYSVQKFKKLINNIHHLPLEEQKWVFEKELSLWKGNKEQIDDITVMGIKL